jgi:hypothetical protein
MSLFNSAKAKASSKPQNQLSAAATEKGVNALRDWLQSECGLPGHQARLLGGELFEMARKARVAATSPTAAEVYLIDEAKISSLLNAAQKIAEELDAKDELEALLAKLEADDARGDGNSI